MDNTQLPPGMFTPERPRNANGDSTIDQVASLSPFFDFASTLSPIAPSRALGGQGMGDAGSAHLTALAGARSPTPLCFNSPNAHKSAALAGKSGGDRKRSNLSKGEQPAALEEVALSASADVLHSVTAFAQSPLRPGVLDDITDVASVAALRKQLESDFNVELTEPEAGGGQRSMSTLEKELLQLDADLGLDGGLMPRLRSPGHVTQRAGSRPGVRGAAARAGAPAGVGAVADMAAAMSGEANKRSSATGASMEFPHGLSKINKKGGEDSPRAGASLVGARSDRGKRSKKSAAALLEEELRRTGRPSSAPASGRGASAQTRGAGGLAKGNARGDRRLSVQPSATPLVKGERPPRHSLDSLGGDVLCAAVEDAGGVPPAKCASKKCNCKKSKCLKLYCECFAAGAYCDDCNCQNCCNTPSDAALVAATRHQIELRNPQAFADKITEDGGDGEARHKKGCHCKKSACLKKYCECFQAGVPCQEYCKCEGCKNTAASGPFSGTGGAASAKGAKASKAGGPKGRGGVGASLDSVRSSGPLATPTRMAQQAAVVAVERAALFMTDDLMIEDFARDFDGDGFDGMKSPGRAGNAVLAAAEDIGLDLLQSPPKLGRAHEARLSEGAADAAGVSGTPLAAPGLAGAASLAAATPMKRGEMSPITPGSRSKVQVTPGSTILRAGPGRLTLNGAPNTRSKQAAPPPRFSEKNAQGRGNAKATPVKTPAASAAARFEVTPKLTRSAKTRSQFASLPGSHDALTGGMIATLGSPTPLSTPEGFE